MDGFRRPKATTKGHVSVISVPARGLPPTHPAGQRQGCRVRSSGMSSETGRKCKGFPGAARMVMPLRHHNAAQHSTCPVTPPPRTPADDGPPLAVTAMADGSGHVLHVDIAAIARSSSVRQTATTFSKANEGKPVPIRNARQHQRPRQIQTRPWPCRGAGAARTATPDITGDWLLACAVASPRRRPCDAYRRDRAGINPAASDPGSAPQMAAA